MVDKKDLEEAQKMCICTKCPSWVKDCKEKATYCHPVAEKNKCIKVEKGCICGACPAHSKYKLRSGYYCTRGSEKNWPSA
ncbi:MAG: DUF2769 domain-containing protein [archaeon]